MRNRRLTVIAFALIGIALVLAVVVWTLGRSGQAELAIPAALGDMSAQTLSDGRPVFVVRHSNDTITVLDAFSTHVPYGISKLVAWCPQKRIFNDLIHGATYDEWGSRVGGPAPVGMTVDSWQQIGNGIKVTGSLGPAAAAPNRAGPAGWAACRFVMHQFDATLALDPGGAILRPEGQWILVEGSLDSERARLCAVSPDCSEFAPVRGVEPVASLPHNGTLSWYVAGERLWLAWNSGGALQHLTVAPPINNP